MQQEFNSISLCPENLAQLRAVPNRESIMAKFLRDAHEYANISRQFIPPHEDTQPIEITETVKSVYFDSTPSDY